MSKFRETASYLTTFDDPTLQGPLVLSEEDFILPSKPDIKLLQSPLGPHSPSYVTRFLTSTLSKKESNSIGFRNGLYKLIIERTLIEVGATIRTCEEAKVYGLATNLGGGTHHAFEGRGSGFTIFNDVAVASQKLLKEHSATRVLCVDLDVHQGDGTASFSSDPSHYLHEKLFTLSVHCNENFPFEKGMSTIDIGISEGTSDSEYLSSVKSSVRSALDTIKPDFVIYIAGVDVFEGDKLGRLNISIDGIHQRDRFVCEEVVGRGVPLACVVGGGYSKDVSCVARRHAIVTQEAAKVWRSRQMYKKRREI